jgi:hypothetical protein
MLFFKNIFQFIYTKNSSVQKKRTTNCWYRGLSKGKIQSMVSRSGPSQLGTCIGFGPFPKIGPGTNHPKPRFPLDSVSIFKRFSQEGKKISQFGATNVLRLPATSSFWIN